MDRPNPLSIVKDVPQEWEIGDAYVEMLGKAGAVYTPEETALIEKIAASRWFLLRNDGPKDKWPCGKCGAKHTYFTLGCVDRPFNGLSEAFEYMAQVTESRRYVDTEYTMTPLGTIEPIPAKKAERLLAKIAEKERAGAPALNVHARTAAEIERKIWKDVREIRAAGE